MIKNFILLLIFFFSVAGYAQPGAVPVENRNGKQCYVHTVGKGQTAYAISKMYNISLNELFTENPEAEKGLQIGENLYIPVKGESLQTEEEVKEIESKVDGEYIEHTVEEGETLYSIARKYGVPAKDLIEANPQQNLSIGSKVVVPLKNVKKENETEPIVKDIVNPVANPGDSIILHKVKKGETLYSISKVYNVSIEDITTANNGLPEGLQKGMKLRVPLKKDVKEVEQEFEQEKDSLSNVVNTELDSSSLKEVYHVAVMIPFFFE